MSTKQELSQLFDGELNALECSGAIDQLLVDKASQTQWRRWCAERALMRKEYVSDLDTEHCFADKFSQALEQETTLLAPENLSDTSAPAHDLGSGDQVLSMAAARAKKSSAKPTRQKPAAMVIALAAAASLAAITLFNVNPFAPSGEPVQQTVSLPKQGDLLAAEKELQALVVAHGEFASMAGLNGLAAYSRIVTANSAQ